MITKLAQETENIEFTKQGEQVTIEARDDTDDYRFISVSVPYNELVKAVQGLADVKPNNQIEELSMAIQGLLREYNFTVNGGVIDDKVAFDAFTANMLLMIDMYKNDHFGYDFQEFTMPELDKKEAK